MAKLGKINRVVTCLTISDVAADNIRMNTVRPMSGGRRVRVRGRGN
jgi:hypothetical protein